MKIWIERDFDSGHLLIHTEEPVQRITRQGSTCWVNEAGLAAPWSTHVDLDLPNLKPGQVAEFELTQILEHK